MTALLILLLAILAGTMLFLATGSDGAELVRYRLRFPRQVDPRAIADLLTGLSGWTPPWWRRLDRLPFVAFETVATAQSVTFELAVPEERASALERLLVAHLPQVRWDRLDAAQHGHGHLHAGGGAPGQHQAGATYRLRVGARPLRVAPEAQARTLLAGLSSLGAGEKVTLQVVVAPHGPVAPARQAKADDGRLLLPEGTMLTSEATTALRKKQAEPWLLATYRIRAESGSRDRAQHLLRRVETGLHVSNAPGAHLRRRLVAGLVVARDIAQVRRPHFEWPLLLNAAEAVGLLALPLDVGHLSGVDLGGCRPLPAVGVLPHVGTVIGDSSVHGTTRPVALDLEGRYRHMLVVGPTGVGKSTLLLNNVLDDIEHGRSVLLIDPKADLVEDLLDRIPQNRADDVVVLDVADEERPVGFNPLRLSGQSHELAAEQLVSIIHKVFAASWGVRSDDLWRAALRTIVTDPEGTLADVGPVLTDAAFRTRLTARLSDPTTIGFWRSFESLSAAEQANQVQPVLNKWRAFMGRPSLRRVLAQPAPKVEIAERLNNGGIVLVPLASGLIGEDAASLFGAVVLNALWGIVQARAKMRAERRPPLMVYLDEAPRYAALPVPLEEMLAQARGYRVGVTLALQHLHQVPTELRQSLLANPRSRVVFQVDHDDGRILARELGMGLTPEDLGGLDPWEVVAGIYAAGRVQPACTLNTRPAPDPIRSGQLLRERSRQRWGVDGAEVDRWLVERLSPGEAEKRERKAPGRRPRGSA